MEPATIERVFAACFADDVGDRDPVDRARLVRGGDEPLFLPAGRGRAVAEIAYARDLPQSCLHEAAHWLIASAARRRLIDYGYWYVPDGRDAQQQARFERAEVEVQALESILADAAGVRFNLSCDNLACAGPSAGFAAAVARAARLRRVRLSPRQERFARALAAAAAAGPTLAIGTATSAARVGNR
ncbi:MAG TPA: elongation factor P hydroxylase [Planctomycetota bacterium]|nr:elongation factor P hydroxylase [Planctomycetota bacterium]